MFSLNKGQANAACGGATVGVATVGVAPGLVARSRALMWDTSEAVPVTTPCMDVSCWSCACTVLVSWLTWLERRRKSGSEEMDD